MKIFLNDKDKNKNIAALLRRAGYHLEKREEEEMAFVRSISRLPFPRFHIYAREAGAGWEINLHLDQKKPSYKGSSAHAGEYDGEIVERELTRIKEFLI